MAHRPFTARQARQNRLFLEALRRTGNPRLAAELLGVHRSTYLKRRAKCPAFALAWDAEIAAAHADFHARGGPTSPTPVMATPDSIRGRQSRNLRTKGGELVVGRTRDGRLQLRRAPKGWMTKAGEQAFLSALSETGDLRRAAAALGVTHKIVYERCRARPEFAKELDLCRRIGRDRALWAQLAAPRSEPGPAPGRDEPMPAISVEEALFQLHFHRPDGPFQRQAARRCPPPVPFEKAAPRIRAKFAAKRRADHHARTGRWLYEEEAKPVSSEAEGPVSSEDERPHDPDKAFKKRLPRK